jgi:hypothetical protein
MGIWAYNVAKHGIYLRIKIVSLQEMYGSHRCVSVDSGLGYQTVSSKTIQRQIPQDLNRIGPAPEVFNMD